MMRRLFILAGLLLCAVVAQAAAPLVRVHVLGKQPAFVNQQIRFEVEILTPNFFTSAPQFPNIQIPGAIITMPDESGVNSTEKIGGLTYASITKTYIFAAQQAGDFALPPLVVKFTYGGDDGKPIQGQVKFPPTKISAKLPEGAAATPGGAAQPVAKVTIKQSFDRAVTGKAVALQAGDALVRTLDTYAELTQAMMIPPPKIDAPNGVRVFSADPKLSDITKDRTGLVGGQRIDRVTYVFEKPGTYTLPSVDVGWFNTASNKTETATAPSIKVVVAVRTSGEAIAPEEAPAPVVQQKRDPFWRHIRWTQWLEVAVALVVLAFAARWLAPRVRAWREASRLRRVAYASSEPALFEAVVKAFHGGKPAAAYAALMLWSRQGLGASVSAWSLQMQDAELRRQWQDFETRLFSQTGAAANAAAGWQGDALLNALRSARKRWLAVAQARADKTTALPTLNPGTASNV